MNRSVAIIGTRGYPSYYGGFETAVRFLAPYLADRGWDVTVFCRPGAAGNIDEADPRIRRVFTKGIETRSLSSLTYSFSSVFHTARTKPDVALVMNVANGFALPLLRRKKIPTLLNVDGIEWERDKWNGLAKKVFLAGAKMSAKCADQLVFDAHAIGEYWKREFGREGVFIPYGGTRSFVKKPLPLGLEERRYALFVARFVPENSIHEFFSAAMRISQHYPVVIVGSSGYGGELDTAASALAKNTNIHWLGHLRDDDLLHSLWSSAGAYFHGHSVGGTNPALVQAMTLGAPIVARDTVYNREVLGDSGILVNPNPDDISSNIQTVLGDSVLQEKLSAASAQRAAEIYTWEKVCAKYETELEKLVTRTL